MATKPLVSPKIAYVHDEMEPAERECFRGEVLSGLAQPQKTVPGRWGRDEQGRELAERIAGLPEYYLARAEGEILAERAGQVALAVGQGRAMIEFGVGGMTGAPALLDAIRPECHVPVDLTQGTAVPAGAQALPKLGFFPGSAIGAFGPAAAVDLLRGMRVALGEDGMLLIGMDLIKERTLLTAAYEDAAGVTAALNLNLAERINRELDGTIPLDALQHRVLWNAELARIELHLEATRDLAFMVSGKRFTMRAHDTIHTGNAHKYDLRSATMLLLAGGWEPIARYCDRRHRFMAVLARVPGASISA